MKNLIFICVFHNKGYLQLLHLLLESIHLYGNLRENTEILIYTSTEFSDMIKTNETFHNNNNNNIKIHTNDDYNSLDAACKSRLDFFSIPGIEDFENILYLDTDIIIKKDLNPIFENIINREVLYVLEEGDISIHCDYWGNPLFTEEEIAQFTDKSAFTSGILLFKNCEVINTLFEKIKKDITNRPCHFSTIDQPYFVYNAMKYKLYDNKKLKEFAFDFRNAKKQANMIINSNKTIIHYCDEVGSYETKYNDMLNTMRTLKENKNLIYFCVFYNEEYIQLLHILLNSIHLFGNLNFSTDILIYTSTEFKNKIKTNLQDPSIFNINANYVAFISKIYFQTNDNYLSITDACKSRLDVFDFVIIKQYYKILYLDVDSVVKNDLNPIFDIIKNDIIYAVEEGTIDDDNNLWGKQLFGNELQQYQDKSAFSSGVLLFKNSEKIAKLFEIIKYDMITRKKIDHFYDQPYIVYNAKRFRCIDNKKMLNYVTTTQYESGSDKTIVHFCGDVGIFINKFTNMKKLMDELTSKTD